MYKLCKSEQSAARQRWLEQGLLQEMLLRRYEDISISDLCARLQIPRKSFYRYFTNKDGALFALIDLIGLTLSYMFWQLSGYIHRAAEMKEEVDATL